MTVTTVPRIVGDVPLVGVYSYPPMGDTLEGQALAIARKYSASVYLPAIQNYSDDALTTPAVNDGVVGGVVGQRIGPELAPSVTDIDASGLSFGVTGTSYGSTVSIIGGALRVTKTQSIGQASVQNGGLLGSIPVTVGKMYSVAISTGGKTGGGNFDARVGTTNEGLQYLRFSPMSSNSTSTGVFTATSSTLFISLLSTGGAAGDYNDWVSVSVKELGYVATQSTTEFKPTLKSAAHPHYWLFDGTDDRLSLSGPLFQMADDHFVVACAKPSVSSASGYIFIEADSAASPSIVGGIGLGSGVLTGYWRDTAGTLISVTSGSAVAADVVFVGSIRQSSGVRLTRNNSVSGTPNNTVLGATTINTANIGARNNGSFNSYFNGPIYGVIAGKGAITDAELLVLEKYLASRGGIQL